MPQAAPAPKSTILHSARKLLSHGKKRITELAKDLKHRNSSHYQIITEIAPFGDRLIKIKPKVKNLSNLDLEMHTLEAINALRSSLDHAVFSLSSISPSDEKAQEIYFPISWDATVWKKKMARACAGVDDAYIQIFESFKPYRGGNNILWALHRYWNINKHRNIAAMSAPKIYEIQASLKGPANLKVPVWDYAREEMIIAECGSNGAVQFAAKGISFDIVFSECKELPLCSALPILQEMEAEVSKILLSIEEHLL